MSTNATETFIISFLNYTSIHVLRTAYSFIKFMLPISLATSVEAIGKCVFDVGVIDALMMVSLGIGHFVDAIRPTKTPVNDLLVGLVSCGLLYIVLCFCFNIEFLCNIWILALIMCINGYLQAYTWPNLLMIVHSQFDPDRYSALLGFWTTNVNFGNMMGFILCQLVVGSEG